MKIEHINTQLRSLFERIIFINECGGDMGVVYRFSDPDGERSGKSGWSFGICQYDIQNNANAMLALREMDFTTEEIAALRSQDPKLDMAEMNAKLIKGANIVDRWDDRQIEECLERPLMLCNEINVEFSRMETFLHIADFSNQFGMSRGGRMQTFLKKCNVPVTPEMIRDFKYTLPWGIKQLERGKIDPKKDDVLRRYNTIARIVIPK